MGIGDKMIDGKRTDGQMTGVMRIAIVIGMSTLQNEEQNEICVGQKRNLIENVQMVKIKRHLVRVSMMVVWEKGGMMERNEALRTGKEGMMRQRLPLTHTSEYTLKKLKQ